MTNVVGLRDLVRARGSHSRLVAALLPWLGPPLAYELARRFLIDPQLGLLVLGGCATALLLTWPRLGVYALLGLACTFWYSSHVPLSFGGVRSDEVELLAYGLIAWWVLRWVLRQPLQGIGVYGPALIVMLAMIVVETTYGITHTGQREHVIANAKTFGLYFLVLPFSALFGTRRLQERLERAVLFVATLGGLAVIGAVATGIQLEGRPGTVIDLTDLASTSRIRPALLPILFLATLIVVGKVSASGFTTRRAAMLAVFVSVWGVSFNRSSWVALALACLLLVLLRPGPRNLSRSVASALAIAVLVPVVYAASLAGLLGAEARAVAARADSVLNGSVVHSASYSDRRREYDDAVPALERQPLFGVGIGGLYGARRPYYDRSLGVVRYQDRAFSHNSWLYLYLQTGLLGVIAFAMLIAAVVRSSRTLRAAGDGDGALRSTSMACALVGVLLEALFNPNLLLRPNIIAFVVALTLAMPTPPPGELE